LIPAGIPKVVSNALDTQFCVPVEAFVFDVVLVPVLALGGGVVDMIGFEMVSAAKEQSATDLSFLVYEDVYSQSV